MIEKLRKIFFISFGFYRIFSQKDFKLYFHFFRFLNKFLPHKINRYGLIFMTKKPHPGISLQGFAQSIPLPFRGVESLNREINETMKPE